MNQSSEAAEIAARIEAAGEGEQRDSLTRVTQEMQDAYVEWEPPAFDIAKPASVLGTIRAAYFGGWLKRNDTISSLTEALDHALDGLDSISGARTPEFFPETSYDCAKRVASNVRQRLAALSDAKTKEAPNV